MSEEFGMTMQRRNTFKFIGGIAIVALIVIAVGVSGYIYVSGGSGKASAPISAPQLSTNSTAQQVYRINPDKSEVQFSLTEVLMGNNATAVGKTNQVTGDIAINLDNPASSTIGTIRIDARTLATDSSMRDRMIRSQILGSAQDQYEYIDFVPTSISGLPDKVVAGQAIPIKIAGNLTIHGQTHAETFSGTVTLTADTPAQLQGTATAQVQRADFNLQIPNVPTVANVSDGVQLTITFVADPVSAANASATVVATTSAQ